MVRPGGHLLFALPVNNFAGHGFYQFSPELLFRALSPAYGYEIREALIIERDHAWSRWYRVADPASLGRRLAFRSGSATQLYFLAQRTGEFPGFLSPPVQSDYKDRWEVSAQGGSRGDGAAHKGPIHYFSRGSSGTRSHRCRRERGGSAGGRFPGLEVSTTIVRPIRGSRWSESPGPTELVVLWTSCSACRRLGARFSICGADRIPMVVQPDSTRRCGEGPHPFSSCSKAMPPVKHQAPVLPGFGHLAQLLVEITSADQVPDFPEPVVTGAPGRHSVNPATPSRGETHDEPCR